MLRPALSWRLSRHVTCLSWQTTHNGPALHRTKVTATPFELSDLVLDLDAEDSKYVRDFTEEDRRKLSAQWMRPQQPSETSADSGPRQPVPRANGISRAEKPRRLQTDPYSPWRVTDFDVLKTAVLGFADTNELQTLLQMGGAPFRARSDGSLAMSYLRHSQRTAPAPTDPKPEYIAEAVSRFPSPPSFREIRRIVAHALGSKAGCQAIVEAGPAIARALVRAGALDDELPLPRHLPPESQQKHQQKRPDRTSPPLLRKTVFMLNNVALALESRGLEMDEALCSLGLVAAARDFDEAAISRFLMLGVGGKAGYFRPGSEKYAPAAIQQALDMFIRSLKATDEQESHGLQGTAAVRAQLPGAKLSGAVARSTLFSLLTGRQYLGTALQTSFRSTIGDVSQAYIVYLHLLGELGAARVIWHEWRLFDKLSTRIDKAESLLALKEKLFSSAMTLAAPSIRAQALSRAGQLLEGTGNYIDDSFLDLKVISTKAYYQTGESDQPDELTWTHMIDPESDESFRRRLVDAIREPDITKSLRASHEVLSEGGEALPS